MSQVYKDNWDRCIGVKIEFIDGDYVPYGEDRNGNYGEIKPDGLVKYSHFERLNEMEGIGRLDEEDSTASLKFGDCYYGFNDLYYQFVEYFNLKPGKYQFYPHTGNENRIYSLRAERRRTVLDIEDDLIKENKYAVRYLSHLNSISRDNNNSL